MEKIPSPLKILLPFVLLLMAVSVVFAATNAITIDGVFGDWAGKAAYVDSAADDETPKRTDVTEFRAFANSTGQYVVLAWDDTRIVSGASAAGITLRMPSGTYYRVYVVADGNPGTVPLSSLGIYSCTDSTCASQSLTCQGSGCSGVQVASGVTWDDPFASRSSPDCDGTNCGTKDLATEMFLPWALIGGAPTSGNSTFSNYGSFPSAAAQAAKDSTGANGISCLNTNGVYTCYRSTPNSVTLSGFWANSGSEMGWLWTLVLAGIVGLGFGVGILARQRRAG